jgi:integrase
MGKRKLNHARLAMLMKRPGRHADGDGLYFRVVDVVKAYWAYRYRADGREREISIGPYPEVSLAAARLKHEALRAKVRLDKVDPLALKRAEKAAPGPAPSKPTFGQIADAYVASHEGSWRNSKHRAQWVMTLTKYCAPIRNTSVDEIDTLAVLKVLTPLWTRAPETASRLRGRIEAVLNAARALGHIDADKANPARWKGHLALLLSNPKTIGERGNHAAMPYADVPAFMAKLKDAPGTAAKALAFAILTAARSGEVFGAKWDEIDLEAGVWTVAKERMKAKREHRVPLNAAALAILREQLEARVTDGVYVFSGARPRQALSVMALAMTMRRLGAGQFTVHGFRSAFRDWAGDETAFPREVAEAALAHAVGDETERAYRRGDALMKRRELMNAWERHCEPVKAANVVSIARAHS